ncbi:hypothetical protein DH2020_043397 [Rehmannia glutinosa]|uniref:histidine kinase n=1 Tax=Rehmannia glutinosa TaxID=99300 RepID=A0ABR0UK97_REHGL
MPRVVFGLQEAKEAISELTVALENLSLSNKLVVENKACNAIAPAIIAFRFLRESSTTQMLVVLSLAGLLIPLWIKRVQNEYKLMIAHNTNQQLLVSGIHNNIRLAFVLLILMIGATVITMCSFVCFIVLAAKREMYLCGALINQMEATQQSERKSMNKSLAFASASHDIRASLAGITGLTEICRNEVTKKEPSRSQMLTNLQQMEACTRDLLGILNSILDTSKIEAGKMQLEEVEFDIELLLEDVVDLYHPVGMKKGVDVILDPYDGSVMKSTCVKGDRGKLKQILSNLLSNAVKFTSDGHVTVRACARKPSLRNASNRNNSVSCLFCWLFKNESAYSESEVVSSNSQRDTSRRTEYVFEVNDTGKGIPKEKQKSVFENYVQVKETAVGQEGTGLGLGIVQSLVRLMGGEIGIVDKEIGERGTCFRFNVFFSTCEPVSTNDIEANNNGDYISEPIIPTAVRFGHLKPFHGSRLYRIIALLPEFGGTQPTRGENVENVQPRNVGSLKTSTSYVASKKSGVNGKSYMYQKSEIEEVGGPNNKKPLTGKKILVADDDPIGRKIATFVASRLSANIFHCENGEEAWKLVCKSLEDGTNIDCILMDCEMPVMDGIEATSRIREAEEIYGVHTPIIALTAHYMGEDIDKMIEAGVGEDIDIITTTVFLIMSPGNVSVYHGSKLKVIDRRVRVAELILRCLICGLAIVSAVLIVTDTQVKEIFTIRKKAKFTDMKALV